MKKILLLSLSALALGCSDNKADAVSNYAEIVHASYVDSESAAGALDETIDALIATPSAATLEAAKESWLASREPYLQTEVYRFYDGPIDNADDGPEGLMNAWPMDEAHVDYVYDVENDEVVQSGIINDGAITIDGQTLRDQNELGGEENVATGYHAIEFLLWGQDFDESGPGNRPPSDFEVGGSAENQERRGAYLKTASTLLLEDLSSMVSAWAPDADNYRAEFTTKDSDDALRDILTGMIVLSGFETGGERLQTALDSGDQEDEHSCFSDNTHRDMIQDVVGIQNVWLGTYGSISGVGIKDVVADVDSELADKITGEIQASLEAANALQPPFDQEIAIGNEAGRTRVQTLITALRAQESSLEDVFRLFDFAIPQPE